MSQISISTFNLNKIVKMKDQSKWVLSVKGQLEMFKRNSKHRKWSATKYHKVFDKLLSLKHRFGFIEPERPLVQNGFQAFQSATGKYRSPHVGAG